MFTRRIIHFGLTAVSLVVLMTLVVGYWSPAFAPLRAADPVPPALKGSPIKELQKERLAIIRENLDLAMKAYAAGAGTFGEVQAATRMLLKAELEQSGSSSESIAILEKFVTELKKQEERTQQLFKTGTISRIEALRARTDRLDAEILLEQTKAGSGDQPAHPELQDLIDLAKIQVEIKRVGVKAAQSQLRIAEAKLESSKAQVAEVQALESAAKAQYDRLRELYAKGAVPKEEVAERQGQWDAAKARTEAAKAKVAECDGQVLLEHTRVELATLEVDEAELRLKQLVAKLPKK